MHTLTSNEPILVGIDGSPSSIDALTYAKRLAEALDAPIEVMITWIYPGLMDYAGVAGWSPEEDARQIIQDAVTVVFGDEVPDGLTISVTNGPAAKRLIAESARASMLVLGSRGHGGFAGLLLGSVSSACAEYAHCPVLIVHPHPVADERREKADQHGNAVPAGM
ncbi:MAG: universal stress protein [Microbacterium sp.]|mgnify:CR=1 FL=1|uniref:universal stress protein n=1 Tax=Microbacterium sp. TaxID=51671 RepID=UPI001ACF287D|nr:universal stress protein [Microbacterium sp.]MBN9153015.1 universal stress protein [Microbacterium sp.]MBN9172945.1 universal stress protein [Microbacterium sp.]